jgi:hypothetical protein
MGMTLREQRDLERERAKVAGVSAHVQSQSSRRLPPAYMQQTSASAQKSKAQTADQGQDQVSRGGKERRAKQARRSPKKPAKEQRDKENP